MIFGAVRMRRDSRDLNPASLQTHQDENEPGDESEQEPNLRRRKVNGRDRIPKSLQGNISRCLLFPFRRSSEDVWQRTQRGKPKILLGIASVAKC